MSRNLALQWKYRYDEEKLTEALMAQESQRNTQMQKEVFRLQKKIDKLSESVGSIMFSQMTMSQQGGDGNIVNISGVATPRPGSRTNQQVVGSQVEIINGQPAMGQADMLHSSWLQQSPNAKLAEIQDEELEKQITSRMQELELVNDGTRIDQIKQIIQTDKLIQNICELELTRIANGQTMAESANEFKVEELAVLPKKVKEAISSIEQRIQEKDLKIEQQRTDLNRVMDKGTILMDRYTELEQQLKDTIQQRDQLKQQLVLLEQQMTQLQNNAAMEERCNLLDSTVKNQELELELLRKHGSQSMTLEVLANSNDLPVQHANDYLSENTKQKLQQYLTAEQADTLNVDELITVVVSKNEQQLEEVKVTVLEKTKANKELKLQNLGLKKKVEQANSKLQRQEEQIKQYQEILNKVGQNLMLESASGPVGPEEVGKKLLHLTEQCQRLQKSNQQLCEKLSDKDDDTLRKLLSITAPKNASVLTSSQVEDEMREKLAEIRIELTKSQLRETQLEADLLDAVEKRTQTEAELAKTRQKLNYVDRMAEQEKDLHDVLVQESEMLRKTLDVVGKSLDETEARRVKKEQFLHHQKQASMYVGSQANTNELEKLRAEIECLKLEKSSLEEDCSAQLRLITQLGEQLGEQQKRLRVATRK